MKKILITGGAKRLGLEMTQALLKNGHEVIVHYCHSSEKALELKKYAMDKGYSLSIYQADFNRPNSQRDLLNKIKSDIGSLDVIINNASLFQRTSFLDSSESAYDAHMNIHVKTPYLLSQYFQKYFKTGYIINITDTAVVRNKTSYFPYLLSKKAMHNLTTMLALELSPDIRVNEIALGRIFADDYHESPQDDRGFVNSLPSKQPTNILQIIDTIEFIINQPVYGEQFFVDGGEHLHVFG